MARNTKGNGITTNLTVKASIDCLMAQFMKDSSLMVKKQVMGSLSFPMAIFTKEIFFLDISMEKVQ